MANKKIIDLTTRVPSVSDWTIFYNEATNKTYKAMVTAFATASTGIVQNILSGTGMSVDSTDPANPIITNTLPDQTVTITAGTNITSVTGTYPNFTINADTQSSSGLTRSISSISSPTTAASVALTDYIFFVSGTTTLTLPTAVGNTNEYTVKNVSGTTTVATTSSQTINGNLTVTILAGSVLTLISDNANWHVV